MVWLKSVSSSTLSRRVVTSLQTVDYISLPRVVIDENQFIHCDLLREVGEIFKHLIQSVIQSTSSSLFKSNSYQVKHGDEKASHLFTCQCIFIFSSFFRRLFKRGEIVHLSTARRLFDALFSVNLIASGDSSKQQSTRQVKKVKSSVHQQSDLFEHQQQEQEEWSFTSEVSSSLSRERRRRRRSGCIGVGGGVGIARERGRVNLQDRLKSESELTCQDLITWIVKPICGNSGNWRPGRDLHLQGQLGPSAGQVARSGVLPGLQAKSLALLSSVAR